MRNKVQNLLLYHKRWRRKREREREFLVLTYLYFTGSFRSGGRKDGGGE